GQASGLAEEVEPFDPVLAAGRVERIESVVADGEPVEAGLTRGFDLVEARDLAGITAGGDLEDAAGVALADQRRVSDEGDRPRRLEPAGDDLRVVRARCAGVLRRIRAVSLGLRRRGGRVLPSARILGPRVRGAGGDRDGEGQRSAGEKPSHSPLCCGAHDLSSMGESDSFTLAACGRGIEASARTVVFRVCTVTAFW